MLGDVRVQLRPEVQIVPRADWPPSFGRHQPPEWTAALSAPGLRITSRLIDEPTRKFLELLREPMAVTAAVLRASEQQGDDPIQILEAAVPLLESLLRSRILHCVDDPSAAANPLTPAGVEPGAVVYGWEILEPLHILSDTQVYRAARAGRNCVLKVVSELATWQKAALRNEAAALGEISHPAVPALMEEGTDLDQPYLVLQWRAGQHCTSAAAELRRLPMPASRIGLLELLTRITEIYAELHEMGVIHGDVQPRNVLADLDTMEVSILDFGFATRINGTAYGSAGAPRGGVDCYRAPELCAEGGVFREATAASEQYALGCLCFELATGAFPVDRMLSAHEFWLQIANSPLRSFQDVGIRGWPDLDRALARSLARKPDARYGSVSGLAAAIRKLRQQAAATEPGRRRKPLSLPVIASPVDGSTRPLYPPIASVNYGAAGIAYAWYRRALADQDGGLLASALSWARTATSLASSPEAFTNTAIGIASDTVGAASLYHSPLGVHLVEAAIAYAAGEQWQAALRRMLDTLRPADERLDLATGRAGQLLACAHALSVLQHERRAAAEIRAAGDEVLKALWERSWRLHDDVTGCDHPYLGIAHGWAGILFSTFTWCRLRNRQAPRPALRLLAELLDQAQQTKGDEAWWPHVCSPDVPPQPWHGWCHGSAGHTLLLCEVSRSLGQDYLTLAKAAARHAGRTTSLNTSLCCGLAGVARTRSSPSTAARHRRAGCREQIRSRCVLENMVSRKNS